MSFVPANGIQLYNEALGSDKALLMIAGIAAALSVRENRVSYWEKECLCSLPDNRGVKTSDTSEEACTKAKMPDDSTASLEAWEIASADLIGV
jgi:hypothetical protein